MHKPEELGSVWKALSALVIGGMYLGCVFVVGLLILGGGALMKKAKAVYCKLEKAVHGDTSNVEQALKEARAEIKSNREDYDNWLDSAQVKLDLTETSLRAQTTRADTAEYELGRQRVRVEALLYALVLAQANQRPLQDKLERVTAEHKRCDKLAIAS